MRTIMTSAVIAPLVLTACGSMTTAEEASSPLRAKCELHALELPVNMVGLTPLLSARINGVKARLILDSGAFFSEVSMASAERFNLELTGVSLAALQQGITGSERIIVLRAKRFELGVKEFTNVEFVATESALRYGAVGLLGQNVLAANDVEYDLANGVVRLFSPRGDCKNVNLAYWAASKPVVVVDLHGSWRQRREHTFAEASVNGKKLRVGFDTGAPVSLMSLGAAKRVGLVPAGAGVIPDESVRGLVGSKSVKTWLAPVKTFAIGTEETGNVRVRFGETALDDEDDLDMLLGADFIVAHRIYVANSQGRLYLTHNGGPVFAPSVNSVLDTPKGEKGDSAE